MAPTTIADARKQALEHLNDRPGRRYAPTPIGGTQDFSLVDRALAVSVERCIDDYAAEGGDRFDEWVSVTTSAADGSASLAAYKPVRIKHVLSEPSVNNLYPVDEADIGMGGLPDKSARPLRLRIVRRLDVTLPASPNDPLVDAVNGRSWLAFDAWVIARAAFQLGIKDGEGSQRMGELVAELKQGAIGQPRTPSSYPWPMPDNRPRLLRRLRWMYEPATMKIALYFDPLWRW